MIKRHALRILLSIAAPLTAFGAGEWALRRIDWWYVPRTEPSVLWSHERDRELADGTGPYAFDPHQLWSPRPGALIPGASGERFNADGYRGPSIDMKQPQRKSLRIVFLGGAATLGVGVPYEDTFPALTARIVAQRLMPCEAMNLGVENYSMRQSLERYSDLARPYQAQVVVLTVSAMTACSPAPGGMPDDQRIRLVRPLEHERSPRSPIAGAPLRLVQGIEWIRDALAGDLWAARDEEFRLKRLQPGYGRLDWGGTRRIPINDFHESLALLRQETRQDGVHLILITIPTPSTVAVTPVQVVYERVVADLAKREALIHLDEHVPQLAALRAEIASNDEFGSDGFPSACGHELIAEVLSDLLVRGIQARMAEPPYKPPGTAPK